mmetsp:Transcript_20400/g.50015  ORF Transcript_20400/g.50015 Transcript_20400/m.50015 type:complete len:272 (-) Transcript_20400:286-1101(-)
MTTHHHNNNTTIPTPENTHTGMVRTINHSQIETILELSLPFLGEKDLVLVSMTCKHLYNHHWLYAYNFVVQKYPPFQGEGRPTTSMEPVMHLPPRIVIIPEYEPENFGPGNNAFPVPLSRQPQFHYNPRHLDTFESLSFMDKTKALKQYVAKFEAWISALIARRAEGQETFINNLFALLGERIGLPQDPMVRNFACLLTRIGDLFRDLNNYPFFQDEATIVFCCFLEKVIHENSHYWYQMDHDNARLMIVFLEHAGLLYAARMGQILLANY